MSLNYPTNHIFSSCKLYEIEYEQEKVQKDQWQEQEEVQKARIFCDCESVLWDILQYSTVQYNTIQYNTMQGIYITNT